MELEKKKKKRKTTIIHNQEDSFNTVVRKAIAAKNSSNLVGILFCFTSKELGGTPQYTQVKLSTRIFLTAGTGQ